jgi:hypothetical protein
MPIPDSQVHAYERNYPGRPWIGTLTGPEEVTADQMVAAIDEAGVDGAILVSPFSMYRYDASYALELFAGDEWPWSNGGSNGSEQPHQVRSGLAAGGNRTRTIGPALTRPTLFS